MRVEIGNLYPGMILDVPIIKDDTLLVKKGTVLTAPLINRLKRFGITAIDVATEKGSVVSTNDKDDFTVGEDLTQSVYDALLENDLEKIEDNVVTMVNVILNEVDLNGSFSNFKYDLQAYKNEDDPYNHAIRVAAFSVVLGYLYNESLKKRFHGSAEITDQLIDLNEVSMAALLHDRGRNCYGNKVLENVEKLSNNESFKRVLPGIVDVPHDSYDDRYISVYSLCLINDETRVSDTVKYMILYSSEMENGNGPLKALGFSKDNRFPYVVGAKIINLCSLYDDYLSHCIHSEESFENIVSVIGQAASQGAVNEELAFLFLNNVPIYSVGNQVELSDGRKATVVKSFTGYTNTTRPVVKVNDSGEIIDLRDEIRMTIKGISEDDVSFDEVVD